MPSPGRLVAVTALMLLASPRSVPAAPVPLPAAVRYAIDAELEPATYRLTGRTEIAWLRRDRPVRAVRFQLFLNAWRNAQSTWMRDYLGSAGAPSPMRWGGIDIMAITLETAGTSRDLTAAVRFVAPDDGNAADRTVLEADLPEAINAADAIIIRLQWTAVVPSYVGETGARGRHFFLAHWSPQLCDLDATGWSCPQAHPDERTPAEAADYDVRLGVPSDWIVGATGRLADRSVRDGRATYAFRQQAVRAFAWTASPDFVDVSVRVPKDASVDVRLLVQPEHRSQVGRFVEAVEESLTRYRDFAPYPFDHLTIVDAAWQTHPGGSGYPALVTVAGRWLTSTASSGPEADLARGAARQWWGQLVAIDPIRDGVTDRALADYVHVPVVEALLNRHGYPDAYSLYEQRYFGGFIPWVLSRVRLHGENYGLKLSAYRAFPTADAPSAARLTDPAGVAAVRAKGALAFATLERYAGSAVMQRALTAVAERYGFQNAPRDQVFATISAAAGQDFSWFFRQAFDRSDVFDYAVTELRTEQPAAGSCPVAPCFRTAVIVRRLGEAEFTGTAKEPVGPYEAGRALTLKVRFADGSDTANRWDGRARWRLFEYESRSAAVSAQIDPERVLLLDLHTFNNSTTREPASPRAATRWAARWAIWLQDLLLTYASLV
jgi:hypothetical protein